MYIILHEGYTQVLFESKNVIVYTVSVESVDFNLKLINVWCSLENFP